jgi:hypothetical protein
MIYHSALPSLLRLAARRNQPPSDITGEVPPAAPAPASPSAGTEGPSPALGPDAVAARVAAFRAQLERWTRARRSGIPLLHLPGVESCLGACLSCGEPLDPGRRYRCRPCVAAVEAVLGRPPVLGG